MFKRKSVVVSFSVLIIFCASGNQIPKNVANNQNDFSCFKNDNVDAFIGAQEYLGKKQKSLMYVILLSIYQQQILTVKNCFINSIILITK
jgi:hypothetical protein